MQFQTSTISIAVEAGLKNFQAALGDFSGPLKQVADDFRAMIAEQFSSEGRAGGTPWAPLAPSTLKRRGRDGGAGILNVSGALRASLAEAGAAGHVEARDALTLAIGTELPYAQFFQTGTGWGYGETNAVAPVYDRPTAAARRAALQRRGMPMRPILVLAADRQTRWVGFVQQELSAKTRALGAHELMGTERNYEL